MISHIIPQTKKKKKNMVMKAHFCQFGCDLSTKNYIYFSAGLVAALPYY